MERLADKRFEPYYNKKHDPALDAIRRLVLQRLKRKMTQSFFGWLHTQDTYKPVGIAMNNVATIKQSVTPQEIKRETSYLWTSFGKSIYVDWWRHRSLTHQKILLQDMILSEEWLIEIGGIRIKITTNPLALA